MNLSQNSSKLSLLVGVHGCSTSTPLAHLFLILLSAMLLIGHDDLGHDDLTVLYNYIAGGQVCKNPSMRSKHCLGDTFLVPFITISRSDVQRLSQKLPPMCEN